MLRFYKAFFLTNRFYWGIALIVVLYTLSFALPFLAPVAKSLLLALTIMVAAETLILFRQNGITTSRLTSEKFSNGDENPVEIIVSSNYNLPVQLLVIDEAPFQFQLRDLLFKVSAKKGETYKIHYHLKPTTRGEYSFGSIIVLVHTILGFCERKFEFKNHSVVKVYPSFLQMRKYELLAASNRLHEVGVKKIRRIGQSMEFEQIREYVKGDDYRTINWRASARKFALMANQFQDEKSQPVYNVIDMGRQMKMPFEGMTLLDYAINASLVISNICIKQNDKAGLITFTDSKITIVPADKQIAQIGRIQDALYNQTTAFLEPNYELLNHLIRTKLHQRSLLILYTNYSSLVSMRRQLKYLSAIAMQHALIVVIFENTEEQKILSTPAVNTEDVYKHTIVEKFGYERKQIVKELQKRGIYSILTTPAELNVNTINKYLELKKRGVI